MKRKVFRLFSVLLTAVLLCCGCARDGELRLKEHEILAVNRSICPEAEANLFLLAQHTKYAGLYGEEIWAYPLKEGSFEDYVKDALFEYLELLYLLDEAAQMSGISLSEGESSGVKRAASALVRDLGEEGRTATGITAEIAEDAFTRYTRAKIYYRTMMTRSVEEISDEEARAVQVEILSLNRTEDISEAQEVRERLAAGETAEKAIAGAAYWTKRTETVVRGDYGGDFDTLVFALRTDEWSQILSMNDGWYLVRCISTNVPEETAKNKLVVERVRREEMLTEALAEFSDEVRLVVNQPRWELLKLSSFAGLPAVDFYAYAASYIGDI